jgi:hypothetical protein
MTVSAGFTLEEVSLIVVMVDFLDIFDYLFYVFIYKNYIFYYNLFYY